MHDMYREIILDHAKNPHHAGVIDPADVDYEDNNPLCGDRLHLTMRVDENDVVTELAWDGDGCAISQAVASMLGDEIIGKSLDEVKALSKEDIFDLVGIPLSMNRVKCALLSLKVLHIGTYGAEYWRQVEDKGEE